MIRGETKEKQNTETDIKKIVQKKKNAMDENQACFLAEQMIGMVGESWDNEREQEK